MCPGKSSIEKGKSIFSLARPHNKIRICCFNAAIAKPSSQRKS